MINLFDYIVSQDFIADLEKNKKYSIITDGPCGINNSFIQWYTFDVVFDTMATEALKDTIIVCISYTLSSHDFVVIDNHISQDHSRISLNPWVYSLREKNNPEENDIITMLGHGYDVREPCTVQQIHQNINKKSYQRIHNTRLPITLHTTKEDTLQIQSVEWEEDLIITIVATPSCAETVARACNTEWEKKNKDIFIQSHMTIELNQNIISSAQISGRILFIIDHKATEEICFLLEKIVKDTIWPSIKIHYLFPQYHLVSSILTEYLLEESMFDEFTMHEYIQSIINE